MLQRICHTILYKWMGWRTEVTQPTPQKCIICVAPHTSNWDFLIGELYYTSIGLTSNFLMKKEWFFWPFGSIFRRFFNCKLFRVFTLKLAVVLHDGLHIGFDIA